MKYISVILVLVSILSLDSAIAQNAWELHKLGAEASNRGDYPEAIKYFTEAYKIAEDRKEVFLLARGFTHLKAGSYQEAIIDISSFIEVDSSFAQAYIFRAGAKEVIGDIMGAINDYTRAIELEPTAEYFLKRSKLKMNLDIYSLKDAKNDIDQAVNLAPKNPGILIEAGKFYILLFDISQLTSLGESEFKKKACSYFSRANELGSKDAINFIKENCSPIKFNEN